MLCAERRGEGLLCAVSGERADCLQREWERADSLQREEERADSLRDSQRPREVDLEKDLREAESYVRDLVLARLDDFELSGLSAHLESYK